MALAIRPMVDADRPLLAATTADDPEWAASTVRYLRWHDQSCCRLYVATSDDKIAGYIAVTIAVVERRTTPKEMHPAGRSPPTKFPAVLLGGLYVAKTARGSGVGSQLLDNAVGLALTVRESFGCLFLVVDSKDDARDFYERKGFKLVEPPNKLALALG